MDTRSKIISSEDATGLAVATLVLGYFDPVLAAHVERLQALGGPVTVSLLDPPEEILPARARAELVASLACVERVIVGDARAIVQAERIADLTVEDLGTRESLIERIRQR